MRRAVSVLAIGVMMAAPNGIRAQQARVGRLPVLELPPTGIGTCRTDPVNTALRRGGITRMISFTSSDSTSHHLVSLGLDSNGRPVMLMAMMGDRQKRRGESESVSVSFGPEGTVVRGRRSAFTSGTPARLSDDRQLALFPADTIVARRLADALRLRCRP